MNIRLSVLLLLMLAPWRSTHAAIRVVVWDERQPAQRQAYSNFLGNAIADYLGTKSDLEVTSVALDEPDQGLPKATLDRCDVLIWWGHIRNREVKRELALAIVQRIKSGSLSLIALHAAHWSTPFIEAMNERTREDALKLVPEAERARARLDLVPYPLYQVPKRDAPLTPSYERGTDTDGVARLTVHLPGCIFPAYRNDGKPSHVTTLLPQHPLARGIPAAFDLPRTEMYDEPFHVPAADAVVFEEKWDAGEYFRSGSVWQVGRGRVIYFRPGHETYPIYREEFPLRIIENAVRWLGEK